MPKFSQLVNYNFTIYLRSVKMILPLISFFALQLVLYIPVGKPIDLMNTFFESGSFTFLIMVWIGFSSNTIEDEVSEQLLILKIRNFYKYYLSQSVVLLAFAFLISLFGSVSAVLGDVLWRFSLFNRRFTLYDFLSFFVLLLDISIVGVFLGSFFHGRYLLGQKYALSLALISTLLSLTGVGIVETYKLPPILKWLFPPIGGLEGFFGSHTYLSAAPLILLFGFLMLYALLFCLLRLFFLSKIKF